MIISYLIAALEPTKIATKKLQYEQYLTMENFCTLWLQYILSLIKIENNNFAKIMLNTISNRERQIVSNKSLLCSIFLNARYKCCK